MQNKSSPYVIKYVYTDMQIRLVYAVTLLLLIN